MTITLTFQNMPILSPVPFDSNLLYIYPNRKWIVIEDWKYYLDDTQYIIKAGFVFDGASTPICCRCIRSSTGILFIAGLIHDWGYKYASLAKITNGDNIVHQKMSRKELDIIFKHISKESISYYLLRCFGRFPWNNHRKNDNEMKLIS